MGYICKDVCRQQHSPQIFVNNSKKDRLGIDVYYCRACNIFIKFKEILIYFINTIFHKTLKKLRCGCCGAKLRVKLRPKRLREKRKTTLIKCKCGCGGKIKPFDQNKRPRYYIKNHGHRKLEEILNRKCLFCNGTTTLHAKNENKTPNWFKYKNKETGKLEGYLCSRCNDKFRYRLKKEKNDQITHIPLVLTS
jgi:hypothetical protein